MTRLREDAVRAMLLEKRWPRDRSTYRRANAAMIASSNWPATGTKSGIKSKGIKR